MRDLNGNVTDGNAEMPDKDAEQVGVLNLFFYSIKNQLNLQLLSLTHRRWFAVLRSNDENYIGWRMSCAILAQ